MALDGQAEQAQSKAGLNWENVNKRILPQLIYKANMLTREAKCADGLFFVCPSPVYQRIRRRLAGDLVNDSTRDRHSVTFCPLTLSDDLHHASIAAIVTEKIFTTHVAQLAKAFSSPRKDLPENAYERAINRKL